MILIIYYVQVNYYLHKNYNKYYYQLLYDQLNYLCKHVNNVLYSAGFTTYCQSFNSLPVNTLDIIGNNNIKYGLAIKKKYKSNL